MRRLVGAAMALVVAAAPAAARTWVVDQYGAGDVRTIQAALDSVQVAPGTDTVVVRGGEYPEHLTVWQTFEYWPEETTLVVCPDGPEATTVLNVVTPAGHSGSYPGHWTFKGMGFSERVIFQTSLGDPQIYWEGCVFRSGLDCTAFCTWPNLTNCDFYGPVRLMGFDTGGGGLYFEDLRFHRAPLTTSKLCGELIYRNCRFEGGPGDTLATALSGEDHTFQSCTFDGGDMGLRIPGTYGARNSVMACKFTGLRVGLEVSTEAGRSPLYIDRCRFEDCTQALVSLGGGVDMHSDSLIGCGDRALVPGWWSWLDGLLVEDNHGIAIDWVGDSGNLGISGSTFRDVDSVAVRTRFEPAPDRSLSVYLTGNRFENCGGAARIEATDVGLSENVVLGSAGDGFSVTFRPPGDTYDGYSDSYGSITHNTLAFNAGHGISVATRDSVTWHWPLDLRRNISVRNGGEGIRVDDVASCLLASNDAWQNYGGNYVGVAPDASNFVTDPLFCGLGSGDLTVSAHSPCSAYMGTGPIGALGTGCDVTPLAAPPLAAPAVVFAARPIPARGSVEFALPARTGAARLDVLDAQGRRVWSAPLERGATSVRWQGERDGGGATEPGVYWARLTAAGSRSVCRFVWLR